MKTYTNKKFDKMISETKRLAYEEGFKKGHESGYGKGLNEGMTVEKTGVVMTTNGIYAFDAETDGETFIYSETKEGE